MRWLENLDHMVLARGKWKEKWSRGEVWVKRRRRTVEWENMTVLKNWLWMKHVKDRWPSKSCTRAPTCTGSSSYLDTSVSRNFGRFHFNQKIRFEFSATSSTSELMAQHFPKFLKVGKPCGVYPNLQKFFPGSFLSIQPFCCSQDF